MFNAEIRMAAKIAALSGPSVGESCHQVTVEKSPAPMLLPKVAERLEPFRGTKRHANARMAGDMKVSGKPRADQSRQVPASAPPPSIGIQPETVALERVGPRSVISAGVASTIAANARYAASRLVLVSNMM